MVVVADGLAESWGDWLLLLQVLEWTTTAAAEVVMAANGAGSAESLVAATGSEA